MFRAVFLALVVLMLLTNGTSPAEVVIEWVTVGDPGNAADDTGFGRVDYVYRIARHEVTIGQYIEFLNAVAASDPNGLYSLGMGDDGGGIDRHGSPGSYTYGPQDGDPNWLNKPVTWVDFDDAMRFANWMHNGQPTGPPDNTTTELGAYYAPWGDDAYRFADAKVFVPTEDEWYKAAYYKGGSANAGYWDYATQSDMPPVSESPPGRAEPPGSANYSDYDTGLAVGPPYYRSDVGAYPWSPSPYGTFDQNGNEWELNEALLTGDWTMRGVRGGGWDSFDYTLPATYRYEPGPPGPFTSFSFRLASVYDPSVPTVSHWGLILMTLLVLTVGTVVLRGLRHRAGPAQPSH